MEVAASGQLWHANPLVSAVELDILDVHFVERIIREHTPTTPIVVSYTTHNS